VSCFLTDGFVLLGLSSVSYRRQTNPRGTTRHAHSIVYTKLDAQCDKLATLVGRTKLTALTTVDAPRRNFTKPRVSETVKVPD